MIKDKKIAIIGPNFHFINYLIPILEKDNQVQVINTQDHQFDYNEMSQHLRKILEWADVSWFEWCSELLMIASSFPKICPIICRIHSNEFFVGKVNRVNWQRVNLAVFTNYNMDTLVKSNTSSFNTLTHIIKHETDVNKFHIPNNKQLTKKIGYVGNINWKKNTPLFLYCCKKIYDYDSSYSFHITGGHEDVRMSLYVQDFCTKNNLNIKIQPWTSNMPLWYEDKDFIINSSLFEGCYYSGAEAMASGVIPMIHNWFGAGTYPKELLFNTPDDCLLLLQQIEKQDRQILIEKNRNYVLEHFNQDKQAEKIMTIMAQYAK